MLLLSWEWVIVLEATEYEEGGIEEVCSTARRRVNGEHVGEPGKENPKQQRGPWLSLCYCLVVWRVLLFHVGSREDLASSRSSIFGKEPGKACIICSLEMVSVLTLLSAS